MKTLIYIVVGAISATLVFGLSPVNAIPKQCPAISKETNYKWNSPIVRTMEEKRALASRHSSTARFADHILFMDEIPVLANVNILEAIQGRIPGVNVRGWGFQMDVSIRGSHRQPLFVLDGMPVDPSITTMINQFDVSNIEIHSQGHAAAFWGMRGGNGVIVINTKRGDD